MPRASANQVLRHPDGLALFTGRATEVKAIQQFLQELASKNSRPPKFLLQFCGVGGTGKTLLAQKAIEEFRKTRPRPPIQIVTLNLDSESWNLRSLVADFFWRLREGIRQRHIRTPLFDTLFGAWWSKAHSALEMKAQHPVLSELTDKLGDSAEFFKTFSEQVEENIPGLVEAGQGITGVKLIMGLEKIRKDEARKHAFSKFFGQLAEELSEGAAERNLGRVLFYDLICFLKRHHRASICFVLDGFERVQSEESRFDPQFAFQEFCSFFINSTEMKVRNRVGCLVFSRNRLEWNELYPDRKDPWRNHLEIRVLSGLSEPDAKELIEKSALAYSKPPYADSLTATALRDTDTIANMLRLSTDNEAAGSKSVFNPFYLDLCIKQIRQVHANGRAFEQADFGDTGEDLKRCFLDSMPKTCRGAMQSLALALIFNEDLFKHLVKEQQIIGYGAHQFALVTNPAQTFLLWDASNPGWYYFHRLMQEALFLKATETPQTRDGAQKTVALILKYVERQSQFTELARCRTEHLVHYRWGMDMLVYLAQHNQLTIGDFQSWFDRFNHGFDASTAAAVRLPYCGFLADFLSQQLGAEDPRAMKAANDFARLQFTLGHYAEAEQWYSTVLRQRQAALKAGHEDILKTMAGLATVKKHLGKLAEAETLLAQALAGFSSTHRPTDADLLSCKCELAAVLKRSKKFAESEKLYREVLAVQEREWGKRNLETLHTMNDLASVLDHQKEYAQAEIMYRTALAGFKRKLGPTHRTSLICQSNLAEMQAVNGKAKKAEKSFKEALAGRENTLPPDHPDILESVYRLANFYFSQGDLGKAEPGIQRALQGFRRVFGEEHDYTKIAAQTHDELLKRKAAALP